jgi:apolipoprotein N-acyltransferase
VKKGANLLCIITNDGWWDDSPAPRQHLAYASLRAIETRRSIARAANTGISAFIDQKGEVISTLGYGVQGSLIGVVQLNNSLTFYVKYGDYIARLACLVALVLLGLTVRDKWKNRQKQF